MYTVYVLYVYVYVHVHKDVHVYIMMGGLHHTATPLTYFPGLWPGESKKIVKGMKRVKHAANSTPDRFITCTWARFFFKKKVLVITDCQRPRGIFKQPALRGQRGSPSGRSQGGQRRPHPEEGPGGVPSGCPRPRGPSPEVLKDLSIRSSKGGSNHQILLRRA